MGIVQNGQFGPSGLASRRSVSSATFIGASATFIGATATFTGATTALTALASAGGLGYSD